MATSSYLSPLHTASMAATHISAASGLVFLSLVVQIFGSRLNSAMISTTAGMGGNFDEESSWTEYNRHLRRLTAPVAVEFQVNTYTASLQVTPVVAALSEGGFVIAWSSDGQDGSNYGIYIQRYSSSWAKYGSEFRANTETYRDQSNAAIAGLKNGGYVVVWNSAADQDGSGYGVYAQRYQESNIPVGSNFLVNTYTTNSQMYPAIAGLDDGGFVIVWESNGPDYGIYGQRYHSSGDTYGSEFQVNSFLDDYQMRPSVTALSDGGYVVVWQSDWQDGSRYGVYAQRFTNTNTKYGAELLVNTYTPQDQKHAKVAGLADGGYIVVWQGNGQDGSEYGIYGKRFAASNVAGSEFQINSYTTDQQEYPAVTAFANGGFIVTWQSTGQDGSGNGVFAQRYSVSGTKIDSEFQVNTYTNDNQQYPIAASLKNGAVVIVWESSSQDGSDSGVYAKLYDSSYFPVTAAPTSVPTDSPTYSPTHFPTSIPTHFPTSSPTAPPTGMPTHPTTFPTSPTALPTSVPSSTPSSLPSAAPTSILSSFAPSGQLLLASSSDKNDNLILIAWTVPVSIVGCIAMVYTVLNIQSRRKLLTQQSQYTSVSGGKSNDGGNANSLANPSRVILGNDIENSSAHGRNNLIELPNSPTATTPQKVPSPDYEKTPHDTSMQRKESSPHLYINVDDDDCDSHSSINKIPKDDERLEMTLQTPITDGVTSSGLAYLVRGNLREGATDTPVVVKFVRKKHARLLNHELKQLSKIEKKMKRMSQCGNTIIRPLLCFLVTANSSCQMKLHPDDVEHLENWIGLVLEAGDRNVRQLLYESSLRHHLRLSILTDLLDALHILEMCNIVHLDVKPTNIVSAHLCCKLIDFDISMERGKPIPIDGTWTVRYAAPEIAKVKHNGGTLLADHKMDMWSFGMVAVEICLGRDYWSLVGVPDEDIEQRLARLTMREIRIFLEQYFSKEEDAALRSVLISTLVINPAHRSGASAVLRKSYFSARDSTVINRRAQVAEEIRETIARISAKMDDIISILKSNEEMLTTLLTGRYMLPSLFVIVPSTKSENGSSFFSFFRKAMLHEYRLYFICPVTKQLAKCGPDGTGYVFRVPKEWLIAVAPAIKLCLCAVKVLVSAYGIPPAMIPTLGSDNWSVFGDTIQQCIRRDGGDAGERAFNALEECFSDATDVSLENLTELTAALQNVTSKSFDQLAILLQKAEGARQPVHASWRPKMTGLIEVKCNADGSTMWVHESVADEYRKHGKMLIQRPTPV